MPVSFDLAALTLGGIMDEPTMERIIEESKERGEIPAKVLCRILKTWVEEGEEGAAAKEPDEFERFVASVGKPIATALFFGCRVTLAKRGCFFYHVVEGLAFPFAGGLCVPEEIADEKGADYLAKLIRDTPASEVMRSYDFEPIGRPEVVEWLRAHVLPRSIPAEFIGDFGPVPVKAPRPFPLIVPTATPKDRKPCFAPVGLHGVAAREWDVPDLAISVAVELNRHREFVRRSVLDTLDEREPFAVCDAGKFAEILEISRLVESELVDGFKWEREHDFDLPGIGAPRAISAAEFLESAACASRWAWDALAQAALASLPSHDALGLLEALCVLEEIGDEWGGLATDLENGGPSRLMRAVGRARLAATMETAAA